MRLPLLLSAVVLAALCAGCGKPNGGNIALRKDNQELRSRLDQLQRELNAAKATIAGLESHATTVPVLPSAQLEKLFTTHDIKIGRLTGEADLDPAKPGNEGLKIYVVPIDQYNQPLKAAGSFVVDAFDLAQSGENRIGHWEIPLEKAQDNFYNMLTLYTYALPAPWQTPPRHKDITVRVSFTDALTGRTFTAQKPVTIDLQAATTRAAK